MEPEDDEILEALQDEDIFTPNQVADEIDRYAPDIAARCRELANHGLVTKHTMGMYDVSEQGERYLAGELDQSERGSDDSA